jgi:toxin ParE1/3/4
MSGFILSPAAKTDIDQIWDYTTDNWTIEQADRYVAQILQACFSISSDGCEGRRIPEVKRDYFKLAVGSHFVIFRIVDGVPDVVRILHQRMDIPAHLQI